MPPIDNEQPVDGAGNHQRSRLREQLSYMHRTGPTRRWARWWRHRINTVRQHRRARWDRPPEPHDWRWGIGLLGRGLVLAGLAMLGFVVYQLWGTGLQTAAAQRDLDARFSALIAETPAAPIADTPSTTAVAPTTTVANPASTTTVVENSTTTTTTIAPTVWPADAGIEIGDPIARIEMPALGTDHIVVAGVGVDELQQGPGHFPDTPLPGQFGNAAIAGHRTTYGQPFHDVDRLSEGDDIVITTPAGRFVYLVTGTRIVEPTDYYVVATDDPTTAVLTLTSCHPKWSAAQRIIVSATLDPTRSDTPTSPTGYAAEPEAPPAALPAADVSTTVAAIDTESDTTAASGSAAPTPTTVTPTTTVVVPEQPLASDAAFSRGWFHDPDAIGSVAIWATVLIAIAVAASRLNRRFRTLAAGTLPALIPFAFALYRFYAEVNRLLPPNL
ncbi:MAG: class E sortase [Actinobacteria bacterium]|nr:class E sortase [Actinomycetota bacterium]